MADRTAPELRDYLIKQLLSRRSVGELTQRDIRVAAATLGCSVRSIRRWMKQGAPTGERDAFEVDESLIGLYYEQRGNVANVHRELLGRRASPGEKVPSRQTLDRAFRRRLSRAERGFVRVGAEAWHGQSVTRREVSHRNEIWEADDKQLPIFVVLKGGSVRLKPWITLFIDLYTRAIMGWVISCERPTRASVIAALRRAIMHDPDEGPFCGIPYQLRWDNGRNFTANDTTSLGFSLGCDILLARPYTPQDKGTVERVNRTLAEMLAHLPFNDDGPKGRNGEPFGPNMDPMPVQKLVDEVALVVRTYNLERPHRSLNGRTPLEAWTEDQTPLRTLDTDILRHQLPTQQRKVMRDGISYEGQLFSAPELRGLTGENVEIRYMPYDLRQIEVFHDATWLCTAKPHNRATPAELMRFHEANRAERKTAGKRMQALSRKTRSRLAPMHEGSEPEVVSPTSRDVLDQAERGRRSLHSQARTNLLLSEATRVAGEAKSPHDDDQAA
jgi:putative transposase